MALVSSLWPSPVAPLSLTFTTTGEADRVGHPEVALKAGAKSS
jgi:hypothetical protein